MSSNGTPEKVVCVTGASGYIASWLVKLLLDRGYTVKATVRNLSDPRKVEHLKALEGAPERLHLFEANLIEEGSFDAVVEGCVGVFHTASPVLLSTTDPRAELLEPAVKGTLNILRSCTKASTIRRVVITSSMASVLMNGNPVNPDVVVDETWFSDPKLCEETENWYALSKTLAEEAAKKYADEHGIDVVTIHPGFVIGPLLQPTLNLTSKAIVNLIKEGREVFADGVYRYVDVRDVADAHILAFENPSARGRYCLVGYVTHSSDALKILSRHYPSLSLPAKAQIVLKTQETFYSYAGSITEPTSLLQKNCCEVSCLLFLRILCYSSKTEEQGAGLPYQVSKERVTSLGVNFTPLETSLKDTVESLKEKNYLSF